MTSSYLQLEGRVLKAAHAYSKGEYISVYKAAAAFDALYTRVRNRIASI